MRNAVLSLSILAVAAAGPALSQDAAPIGYPDGYRAWHHIKSMVIQPGHPLFDPFGGLHHIYANDAARAGLESGNYANGAIFVFDLLEAKAADNAVTEGPRKLLGVMQKDTGRFAATGGWGFEAFAGDSRDKRLVTDGGKSCFACHEQRKQQDYVFATWRE